MSPEQLRHIADVRRGQAEEDRSALLELLRVEPLPLDDPPVMVRSWTEGLRLLAQDMGFYRGEREIAEALRSKPEPRFGECLPVGPLGQSISGRQASLRVVLVRDRAALAVYFDDTRMGPAIQLDRAEAVADQPSPTAATTC